MNPTDQLVKTLIQEIKDNRTAFAVLGDPLDTDIEALCFLVLMQAAKSAQEDLRAIMEQVKKINKEKQKLRELMCESSERLLFSRKQKLNENQLRAVIAYLMKPC